LISLATAVCLLSGCAAGGPAPETMTPDFGRAFRAGFSAQVLHPDGPADPSPADTLPGELAVQIYNKRYLKNMTEPEETEDALLQSLRGLQ